MSYLKCLCIKKWAALKHCLWNKTDTIRKISMSLEKKISSETINSETLQWKKVKGYK